MLNLNGNFMTIEVWMNKIKFRLDCKIWLKIKKIQKWLEYEIQSPSIMISLHAPPLQTYGM